LFVFFHFFHWWNLFKFYLFLFSLTFDDHAYIPKCRLYIFSLVLQIRYNIQNNEIKKKKVRNRGEGTIYKGAIISNISFYIPWRLLTSFFFFSIGTHPRRHLFLSNFFSFSFFFYSRHKIERKEKKSFEKKKKKIVWNCVQAQQTDEGGNTAMSPTGDVHVWLWTKQPNPILYVI
jgi:hypothetical protein